MKSNVIHKKARSHLYNFYDMQQRESEGKHVLFPFFFSNQLINYATPAPKIEM